MFPYYWQSLKSQVRMQCLINFSEHLVLRCILGWLLLVFEMHGFYSTFVFLKKWLTGCVLMGWFAKMLDYICWTFGPAMHSWVASTSFLDLMDSVQLVTSLKVVDWLYHSWGDLLNHNQSFFLSFWISKQNIY